MMTVAAAARALIDSIAHFDLAPAQEQIAALEAALAAPAPRLIINVTGGMVQGASIDRATDIDVLILDFDNDDEDDDDIFRIPSEDGVDAEPASAVELGRIDVNPEWVGKVYAAIDEAE